MCRLMSTSTEWKESKWTGQYECSPRRALGGIRNSWTAAGTSREACKVELQMVHYNESNHINIVTGHIGRTAATSLDLLNSKCKYYAKDAYIY